MKQTITLIVTLIVIFIIGSGSSAVAGKYGNKHHGDMGHGFGGMRQLMDLDLSDLQKTQVYDIMTKYKDEQEATHKGVLETRKQMESVIFAESFNENDFRQAFQQRSALMEELAVIKAKTFSEIKNVLTPEQVVSLKEKTGKTGKKGKRMRHRSRMKQCMMESWLKPDSE